MSSDFANVLHRVSYITAEESLKILEWVNNNVQRYSKLSTPVDEKLHQDNTITCAIQTYRAISDA